jgi:type VI secretion system protein ImpL
MNTLKQWLLHPRFWASLGVLALSALLWWAGPLMGFGEARPLEPAWVRLIGVVLLLGGLALSWAYKTRKRHRANAELVRALSQSAVAAQREVEAITQRFDQAMTILSQTPSGQQRSRFARGQMLYELPWYVFVGAPGSGKTTALLNAGLTFPLAEKMGAGGIQGVGGTRHCDWWFTDEAVLIDTAGRYTTQDSDRVVDARAWAGFLALLRKSRPRRPINGVLLTVNIQDLLQQNPVQRKEHASRLRARLQELSEQLGVRAPVYVLVTKVDLIAGFQETFEALGQEQRRQVWGFSLAYGQQTDDPLASFGSEFAALEKRIRDRVLDVMDAQSDVLRRAAVFSFPQQFAGIKGLLGGFLESVFSAGGSLEDKPLLRGVYFTSGTQEGTPIDRVLGALARTFGLDRRMAAGLNQGRGKSFFLQRLLREVVFAEQGLVSHNPLLEARRKRQRFMGLGAVALAGSAVLAGWFVSYSRNTAYVGEVEARLHDLQRAVEVIPPANTADVTPLPVVLSAVQSAAQSEAFALEKPSFSMTLGLFQGDKLQAGADLGYERLLQHSLWPRILKRCEERLRSVSRDNLEQAYETLKAYVMLNNTEHFDADALKAFITVDWDASLDRSLKPEDRSALNAHLDALLKRGVAPQTSAVMDASLVANVRDMLVAFPLEYRVFSRLKRAQIGADLPAFTVAGAAGPSALQVLERASGEPLTQGIPGLFTKAGYQSAFQPAVEKATRQLADEEPWVLGIKAVPVVSVAGNVSATRAALSLINPMSANPEFLSRLPGRSQNDLTPSGGLARSDGLGGEITQRVRRLYLEEYIKVWDRYLADVRIAKLDGQADRTLSVARTLSAVDSPLVGFLRGVARETSLVPPPEASSATSANTVIGSATARLDEKAAQAKRELSAVMGTLQTPTSSSSGTTPIEQMVDDHFAHIQRLFKGQPAPIQDTLKLFEELYVHLAAVDSAQKSKSAPPPAAGAQRVVASAAQQPEPVRGVLEKLAGAAAVSGRSAEREVMSSELKPISDLCRRSITGRYPFTASSKADVLPDDFAQLFGQGGALDEFFRSKLANLVDTSTTPWSFKPTGDGTRLVNPAALADFQRAARIREVFFRSGGKQAGFKVDIRAVEISASLAEVNVDVDGQVFKFTPGNTAPITIQWPSARVASQIKLDAGLPVVGSASAASTPGAKTAAQTFSGPWALFRLFDRFDVQPTAQPERFFVSLGLDGKPVRLEVTASSVFNPFRLREMQQFRCPGAL